MSVFRSMDINQNQGCRRMLIMNIIFAALLVSGKQLPKLSLNMFLSALTTIYVFLSVQSIRNFSEFIQLEATAIWHDSHIGHQI